VSVAVDSVIIGGASLALTGMAYMSSSRAAAKTTTARAAAGPEAGAWKQAERIYDSAIASLQTQNSHLETRLEELDAELSQQRLTGRLFERRIASLEALLTKEGITLPPLEQS
jgi:predicted RNase H-like nuclease (RuvC/YqgF family)